MAKNKYSDKFDTFIDVADKTLLTEYLATKGLKLEKDPTPDYVHDLLNEFKSEEERLDIAEEVECIEDIASQFFQEVREFVLDQQESSVEWSKDESNETIILRIFLKHEKSYNLIYDLFLCDKFWARLHHYILEADGVRFDEKHIKDFKDELTKYLSDQKREVDCDIREREYKGRHYVLILRGDEKKTVTEYVGGQKKHRVFCPYKEDMIVYDKEHSMIALTPDIGGSTGTKNKLFYANIFNKHILGGTVEIGKEFFSADSQLVDLAPLFDKKFYERTQEIQEIKLVYIFAIKDGTPITELRIKSEDIWGSVKLLNLNINKDEVVSVKIEVYLEGQKQSIPVQLTKRSTGQIKGRKEREIIENFLRTRKVILF